MRPGPTMATPAKIVLKSSTKISLNDRFTNVMKTRPVTTASIRAQVATERLASEKNRRLAQQMERRPSVAAELGGRPAGSVRDRLGTIPGRGRSPHRGGRFQTRGQFIGMGRGRGGFSRGIRGRTPVGRRGGFNRGISPRGRGGRGMGARGGRGMGARGGRGSGARGRGRGRGRGGRQQRGGVTRRPTPNKDKLDEQLDSYMTKTKGAMNAELDSYMAEIGK